MRDLFMNQYLFLIKAKVDTLAAVGSKLDTENINHYILNGLSPNYQTSKQRYEPIFNLSALTTCTHSSAVRRPTSPSKLTKNSIQPPTLKQPFTLTAAAAKAHTHQGATIQPRTTTTAHLLLFNPGIALPPPLSSAKSVIRKKGRIYGVSSVAHAASSQSSYSDDFSGVTLEVVVHKQLSTMEEQFLERGEADEGGDSGLP